MKLDYPRLFKNPMIASGQYLATVKSIDTIDVLVGSESRTAIQVTVELDYYGAPIDGTRLLCILQPTDKGQQYISWFLSSYRVSMSTLDDAIGRWASIYVCENEHNGTFYSSVRFQRQTSSALKAVAAIEDGSY